MKNIAFYIALPFLYLIALFPYPLFHGLCDIFYFIVYYILGYRKKVVYENLRKSFPEKTEKEINSIAKKFYRYLIDLLLETFKTLTFTSEQALKHCSFTPEAKKLFDHYAEQNKSLIIVMGHYGNWEWAGNTFSLQCKHQLYVIYHPLTHPKFNELIIYMRTKFGTKLIAMRDTFRDMVKFRDELNATAFIADQTPAPESAHWMQFLNQDTGVFLGTEKIAKKMNYPIVYATVKRLRRGFYEIHAETLFENPKETRDGEITEAHTLKLEKDIQEQPEIWLWSHRRWKHKRPSKLA
jgi:KDO2-lipid IV(A) lauroyltransferase